MVQISIYGANYEVPEGLTVIQAIEYTGVQLVHGVGCRGGVCGACATVYRMPDSAQTRVALGCQTVVEPGMHILQVPYFPDMKAMYDIEQLQPDGASITATYPETMACIACNTCTKMCPKELPVMDFIAATLQGDLPRLADHSFECVMCGLCAVRCPANIAPYRLAMLGRRLVGRHLTARAPDVTARLEELRAGVYDAELDELMTADKETLESMYAGFRAGGKS